MASKDYFKWSSNEIFEDIVSSQAKEKITIKGIDLVVYPHVYPSDKFRTTNFVLENLEPLFKDKTVCDMGCGLGIVGQFALRHEARKVVQVDINPIAVKNALENNKMHGLTDKQVTVYQSDIFDNVPKQTFDMIIWNMPFHTEAYTIKDPLEYAFHDPLFKGLKKLLSLSSNYSHPETLIFIAFSSKGDIKEIEEIFNSFNLKWDLWKITNTDQEFDNRIYRLKQSH